MGGPRLIVVGVRPVAQTLGDVLHEIARLDSKALKDIDALSRWKLKMLKVEPPPLRAKDLLKR